MKYGYWMQVVPGQVAPGIDVGMEGLAKLLDGLLGFTLGVEGRALMRFSLSTIFCHLLGSIRSRAACRCHVPCAARAV